MNNLKEALHKKGISIKEYANFLGVSEKTARNKLNGTTTFTYPEALNTKKFLFREYDLEYLFTENKTKEERNEK